MNFCRPFPAPLRLQTSREFDSFQPVNPVPIETSEYSAFSERLFDKSVEKKNPLRGQIELTYRCNIRCVHCYTDCFNNPQDIRNEMTTSKILSLIDEMHAAGCLWLCLTGGEIFMRKDFFEIYDTCMQKGFILTLFTNATLVTEASADRLAANPPFCVETSCHGVGATFDRITQVAGSFKRFDKGVRLLLERGIPLKIKTNALTLNRGELGGVREYVESLGLEFRLDTAIQPDLKGCDKTTAYSLSPEEIVALDMNGVEKRDGGCCQPANSLYRCGCGINTFMVGAHGKLAACSFSRQIEKDLNKKSFKEATGELFSELRSLRFQGDSPCRTCQITPLCGKKPGMMVLGKNPEDPVRHFCDIAHLKAKKMGIKVQSPFERSV